MRLILVLILVLSLSGCNPGEDLYLISVNGKINGSEAGFILEHEHMLVDFSGAEGYNPAKWNRDSVVAMVLPHLRKTRDLGVNTILDATPMFIGRDALLLRRLSAESGLNIITNTGLYGAVDRKFLPDYVYGSSPQDLADMWIDEFENGIDDTNIRPGFMKISVNAGTLGDVESKLVEAACIAHRKTGMTIASHTGPAIPAFEELKILEDNGIHPSAFVWIHAQNEKDWDKCVEAAQKGAWIGFDGLNDDNVKEYVERISFMRENNALQRLLISHDAGWYDPDKEGGGNFRPFNTANQKLIPALYEIGFSDEEIDLIFKTNPFDAFAIRPRLN